MVHGHRRAFVRTGAGSPLLLLHLAAPDRFAEVLLDFIAGTQPVEYDRDGSRALLAEQRALAGR